EAFVDGEASACGRALAEALLAADPGVEVWGGEPTVVLPPRPGRGGRAQTLALSAARVLAGHPGVLLLAAGTDGTDGPTEDAGALVDGGTIARGGRDGLDPLACLRGADAGTFLAASGDLIHTGPTGTNVMDLMVGLKAVPER
ncbi:MAG: hydroxypyruvate reductase, partial [Gammaproteobacteria bacterium]|nr:hydroxypyruvate reductase [Gammaproteobacteria bacterium]